MNKVSYITRKNYVKFDDFHYLLYLNEEATEVISEQSNETVPGFAYQGSEADGGTMIEAKDVTDDNRRDKFIAGLIGTEYDINDQIAILANGNDTQEHSEDLKIFEQNRAIAKEAIAELLARAI